MWSIKPSRYEHLRIFGCVDHAHTNDGKLKPRVLKCIFVGYLESVKWYKLWNDEPRKHNILLVEM